MLIMIKNCYFALTVLAKALRPIRKSVICLFETNVMRSRLHGSGGAA